MNKWLSRVLVSLIMLAATGALQAAEMFGRLPDIRGPINRVGGGTIVVADRPFLIRPAMIIEDRNGKLLPLASLVPGQTVLVFSSADSVPGTAPMIGRLVILSED